ncbi:hypothetical protein B0H14DRAFT_2544135 [Mycena olivaceomarginata]|nr:hypothetical protein B0H14DRAFT_2544135 [Mycena olivaceomarginata]
MISANATSIADFRNTKRNHLAEVKAKIYALKSSLEQLEEEYEELQGILDTIFYPISAVPDDVVSRIFVHCLREDWRVRPSQRAAPLNLVRISKHWSTVALSTSELWCSVELSFTSSWGDYGRKMSRVTMWPQPWKPGLVEASPALFRLRYVVIMAGTPSRLVLFLPLEGSASNGDV